MTRRSEFRSRLFASFTVILAAGSLVAFGSAEPEEKEKKKAEQTPPEKVAIPATVPKRPKPQRTAEAPKAESPTAKARPRAEASAKAAGNPRLPKLLAEVEKKYADAATVLAEFEQVNKVAALNRTEKTSGNIAVKRPGKVRWQTLLPEPNLFVSDGRTYWFYTPPFDEEEPGQVIIRQSNEVQSELANALLSGSFSKTEGMKIEEKSPSHFVLHPKKGSAGTVREAEVHVDPEKKLIERVVLEHEGGNRSDIRLSEIQLGKPLEDRMFHFTPPPNTERIDP